MSKLLTCAKLIKKNVCLYTSLYLWLLCTKNQCIYLFCTPLYINIAQLIFRKKNDKILKA